MYQINPIHLEVNKHHENHNGMLSIITKTQQYIYTTMKGSVYTGISLGEDFYGYRYKLLASIIQAN